MSRPALLALVKTLASKRDVITRFYIKLWPHIYTPALA